MLEVEAGSPEPKVSPIVRLDRGRPRPLHLPRRGRPRPDVHQVERHPQEAQGRDVRLRQGQPSRHQHLHQGRRRDQDTARSKGMILNPERNPLSIPMYLFIGAGDLVYRQLRGHPRALHGLQPCDSVRDRPVHISWPPRQNGLGRLLSLRKSREVQPVHGLGGRHGLEQSCRLLLLHPSPKRLPCRG